MYNFTRILNITTKLLNQNLRYQIFRYSFNYLGHYTSSNGWIIPNVQKLHNPSLQFVRNYAKSKDKKKEKGKVKVQINETQLAEVINLEALKNQLQRPIEILKEEFIKNLSIRTASGSIENMNVNFDGHDYTLQELGQVIRKNPSMIVVHMSVFPQAIPTVIKAIQKSGMNLNPQQEGTTLYIPVPKVTKEHRENLAKNAKQLFIKCKDNIRDAQIKHVKSLKKKQSISEDFINQTEQQIIALADTYITQAQMIYDNKCNELLNK